MGKQGQKKKGGKKEQPSQSSVTEPSTSAPAKEEEDVAHTGGARKKQERKEKKEKALQALQTLQASKKPSATSSDSPSEPPSRGQSEAPSEPSTEVQPGEKSEQPCKVPSKAQIEPPKTKPESKVEEVVEEFGGLGLTGSKKTKPRKKKAETTPPTKAVAQQVPAPAAQVVSSSSAQVLLPGPVPAIPSESAPGPALASAPGKAPGTAPAVALRPTVGPAPASASEPAIGSIPVSASRPAPAATITSAPTLVQMSEPVKSTPPGPWGRGSSQTAGRGRGRKPPETLPSPVAGPSASRSFPVPSQFKPQQIPQTTSRSMEPVLSLYKIPTKIPGNSVPARQLRVLVNYLQMEFEALQISRYDVTFTPDRPKKMLAEAFKKVKKENFPNELVAFDQIKNCYSLRPITKVKPGQRFNTTIELKDQNGKVMNFEVSMKATGVVDLGNIKRYMASRSSSLCHPTEEIQCIDVILRQGALEGYVKAGRQFFKRPQNPVNLEFGYEMWTGLFQSAIFTNKAFINIDVAHKGFPKHQSLLDILVKDFGLDPRRRLENQRGGDSFANFVKGLKVVAMLVGDTPSSGQRREYICNGMVDPPGSLLFPLTDAEGRVREITVGAYFATEKRYNLQYPELNCLWVGSRDRRIYFPLELLTVAYGQALTRQLNETQVSKMVREAATPPNIRLQKITDVISSMKYSENPEFKRFGLNISNKFYQVQAKVLNPPTIEMGSGEKIVPRKGQWQANRLLKPEPLQSWGIIAVDTDPRNDYDNMISLIISTGNQMGMSVAQPKIVNLTARMRNLYSILLNAYSDVRFVFIVVSARSRDDYHRVKQMAEREVGILTQCVKEMTVRRINVMTVKNILLKVNSKLMGINQALESKAMPKCLKDGDVMIVGADVTHPSPDQANVPSIAAVTASMDPKCYIYNIELSIQTPKKEMIVEFADMMFDHLRVYRERNGNKLPKKIFVFRDGVSEGQFAEVMNSELQAVHNAYQRMAGPSAKPEVLFLLVQKRHHTRFFNEGRNSSYNVEPGTVVDTDIVHASELDFYMVSHQAIKGTARPTRYHAVCNDGKIPDDEVEQLTYYLCHLYARCTKSVSYPTPTYYAHLACLRARSLTHGERFDNKELERKPKRLHVLDKMLQFSRMFFV